MTSRKAAGSVILLLLLLSSAARSQDSAANSTPSGQQWVGVVDKVHKAIVTIETQEGLGTGFLIQKNGTLVTNFHVIKNAKQITVTLESGEAYKSAYLLRTDEEKDIAVLRIEGADLPFLTLGNSDAIKVGEEVMAIGTPEGLEQTVSTGIVSGRRLMPPGYQLIQTTAPISHGSSGGPLLNRTGECIGITAASLTDGQNLNFAIPINYVRGIIDTLALSPNTTPRLISGTIMTAGNSAAATNANRPTTPIQNTEPQVSPKINQTPQEIITAAKTIFIRQSVGNPELGIAIERELLAWKRFAVIGDQKQADLILEIQPTADVNLALGKGAKAVAILSNASGVRLWSTVKGGDWALAGFSYPKVGKAIVDDLKKFAKNPK